MKMERERMMSEQERALSEPLKSNSQRSDSAGNWLAIIGFIAVTVAAMIVIVFS